MKTYTTLRLNSALRAMLCSNYQLFAKNLNRKLFMAIALTIFLCSFNRANAQGPPNLPPTDIALSPTSVNENVPANTVVGTLSTEDPDAGNTFTYSLVSGTGSTDNSSFIIAGNGIKINISPDYETESVYAIRVKTTDQGGFSFEKEFTITINDLCDIPTPTISAGGATTFCTGGSVVLSSSSTTGNQWYVDGNIMNGETNQDYTATASGTYTVVVAANGCSSSPSLGSVVTVNVIPSTPTISAGGATTFCTGDSVTLSASGASILYQRYASTVINFSSEYTPTDWSANQVLGAPDVYPSYGDLVNAWASLNADDSREYLELGYSNPAPINFIDIYETYSPGAVDTVYVKNPNTGLFEIVYTATAVAAPAVARILHITFPETSFNVSEIRIAINSGAVPDFNEIDAVAIGKEGNYLWSTGANTQSITVKTAGSYTVQVTNSNGCSATSAATTVTVNSIFPTITVSTLPATSTVVDFDNTASAITGSFSFWPSGTFSQPFTPQITGQLNQIGISVNFNAGFVMYDISLSITDGVTTLHQQKFSFSGTGPRGITLSNPVNVISGSQYYIIISWSWIGDPSTMLGWAVDLNNADLIYKTYILPTPTVCAGSPATLTASGATSYSWSGGVTNGVPFNPSTSATYTVTGTTNGCSSTATQMINVTPNNTAGVPSSNPTACINTALTDIIQSTTGATGIADDGVSGVNGLPAGVSATWASDQITISGTPTASGTFNYSIPLTGGCGSVNATGAITVGQPTTSDTTAAVCNKFTWHDSTYKVSTDAIWHTTTAAGCDSARTLHLTILSVTSTTSKTDAACYGSSTGAITVNPTDGVSPFTYRIGTVSSYVSTNTFNNLRAGKYRVSILDANGCAGITSQVTITQPLALTGTASVANATCYGGAKGSIAVTPSTGIAPYMYKLGTTGTFGSSNLFSNLKAGAYRVYIQDINSCVGNIVVTLTQPTKLSATHTKTDETCPNAKNGSLTVTGAGGTANTFNNLKAAQYRVFINDANNCTGYSIGVPILQTQPICPIVTRDIAAKTDIATTQQGLAVQLSPNPSNSYFTLRVKATEQSAVQIRVIDVNGRSMFTAKGLPEQAFRFGESFAPGLYMIEVRQGDGVKTVKAVKN